ncbi:MAG: NAD(P)H-dependent oxidoreductase subunit E [Myxococcales bacterium]|nr:NAD(P)H-dependent oxidoreductase subunit E [Myxococcales bacterium]MDH5306975.1 NAD(P)H-dependent oxidoreductase subunit E [Myxococcales bacterium]MDH5565687.1 NAD(P)H-dependent oxidoreductase subunit E [Myxococcales bacterium]
MVISEDARARIASEIAKYPVKRGALLPALHIVHEELGHVSTQTAVELAEIFEIRPGDVMEVVSFYNMFHATPQPRHHVHVCTNLSCSLRGSRELLRALESYLSVDDHGNTADGRIHLGHEECLGACAYAPMLRVGDVYHEDLDLEKAKRILDELD